MYDHDYDRLIALHKLTRIPMKNLRLLSAATASQMLVNCRIELIPEGKRLVGRHPGRPAQVPFIAKTRRKDQPPREVSLRTIQKRGYV